MSLSSTIVDVDLRTKMASGSESEPSVSHKSDIWKYFSKDKDHKKAKCQLCSKEFTFHSGTTNLREHLMSQHGGHYKTQDTKCGSKEKQGTHFQNKAKHGPYNGHLDECGN